MRFLCLCGFFLASLCHGQNKQLLYNVNELPQTLMLNPGANINFDGHFGIPFLSQFHLSAGSSGVNVHDIFENSTNTTINQRVGNTIKRLRSTDFFTFNQQLEIISLGWRLNKDNYLSMGIYQEIDAFSYFPKDPITLVNVGNKDYINIPFNFSHVSFTGELLTVYHLGLNKKWNNRLTVGARLKLYSGIFNVESTNNSGTFLTINTPQGPNYYRHFADNLDVRVNTSGFASLQEENNTIQDASKDLLGRSFFGGNLGVGLDVGGTYRLGENIMVSGSVLDLGMMWQRDDVESYTYRGTYQTNGIEPLFPENNPNGNTFSYWDLFEDEVDRNLVDETLSAPYTTWRPLKFNAAVEMNFDAFYPPCDYRVLAKKRYRTKLGMHLYAVKRPRDLKFALSTYYDRKISSGLRMKVSYTLDDFSYTNVGLLLSTRIKKFNFYIAADNLFGYLNLAKSNYQSVQLGLQFISNK
jgi:hypothetical protein